MSEELKGGIEAGDPFEEIDYDIDPELVDDRDVQEEDTPVIVMPKYDHTQFEMPDDYEEEDDE